MTSTIAPPPEDGYLCDNCSTVDADPFNVCPSCGYCDICGGDDFIHYDDCTGEG
jgi:hypothetical protein